MLSPKTPKAPKKIVSVSDKLARIEKAEKKLQEQKSKLKVEQLSEQVKSLNVESIFNKIKESDKKIKNEDIVLNIDSLMKVRVELVKRKVSTKPRKPRVSKKTTTK
jgi:hypothetical protein